MENTNIQKVELPSGKIAEILKEAPAWVILDLAKQKEDDRQKFLVESMVKSIDGVTENLNEVVRNLTIKDFRVLDKALAKLLVLEELPN